MSYYWILCRCSIECSIYGNVDVEYGDWTNFKLSKFVVFAKNCNALLPSRARMTDLNDATENLNTQKKY